VTIVKKKILCVLLPTAFAALLCGFFFTSVAIEAGAASKPSTEFTKHENARYKKELPFETDIKDEKWTDRGFIARPESLRITKDDGAVVWDMSRYAYIEGNISKPDQFPDTVNPSLWRNAILNNKYGLYEVVSRDFGGDVRSIYQVRGYDIANISFVETQNGFIVVDVLSYNESAAAAVRLFYDHLPERKKDKPIHTVIYTHSHGDHYGGMMGVLKSGKTSNPVAIIAPDRFWEEALSENVTFGSVMRRRGNSM
jgi:alkyl sulfatase BDS1-like metallo-beta-lactamase superfamily hydrolase